MIENEFKAFIADMPWKYGKHEIRALREFTLGLDAHDLDAVLTKFVLGYEHRNKPPMGALIRVLRGELGEHEAPAQPAEPDLPRAEAYAAYHFYAVYLAAETPNNRREAIKAYYLRRQELDAPLFGKEEDGIRALLAACDAQIEDKPACVAQNAESEPQDECVEEPAWTESEIPY